MSLEFRSMKLLLFIQCFKQKKLENMKYPYAQIFHACKGSDEILGYVEERLGISVGESTPDEAFFKKRKNASQHVQVHQ